MSLSSTDITIYSKADCPLCEEMMEIVDAVKTEERLNIEYVDITSDPELQTKYGMQVPVLFIDGRKAFKARVTKEELLKKIAKAKQMATKTNKQKTASLSEEDIYYPPRPIIFGLLVAAAFAFSYFIWSGFEESKTARRKLSSTLLRVEARNDSPVPFALQNLKGEKVELSALKDKVVFLNFWATWCPPCIEEMPSIRRLHKKLDGRSNFVMLLVSADESWAPVKQFFEEEGAPFTVLLDTDGEIAKKYGTTRFPETFVVVDGKIQAFIEGPRDWDTWYAEAFLESFLKG